MNNLWAISGENGVGKDTVGTLLHGYLGEHYTIEKFAAIANECYKLITGMDFLSLPREEKELNRADFKRFCEDLRRDMGTDVWTNALFRRYDHSSNWIITDLRFTPEVKRIHNLGGILIRVTHSPLTHKERELFREQGFRYFIVNDEDISTLSLKVGDIVNVERRGV